MRIFACIIAMLLASCGREPLVQTQSYVFGTLVDISIYGESEAKAHEAINQVLQKFQQLHNQLHAWQPDSELSRLNQSFAAGNSPFKVTPELSKMLIEVSELSSQSGGLFNPALGHLIHAWGFQRDEFTPVQMNDADVQKWLKAQPSMSDIIIKNEMVHSTNPAVKLDLGGYAKGYALDQASNILRAKGIKNALVNIGGNIIALGKHGDKPWRVGIQHPRLAKPMATLELLDGWAVGTSGDYQRYFELNGQRYCHILDPRTGYPKVGTQAVTVLIPPGKNAGVMSDVASKPIFIAGENAQAHAAKKMGVSYYLITDAKGKFSVSEAMQTRLSWLISKPQMTLIADENNDL
jgi:thiamine biosynthesis lipoprotein